MFFSGPMGDSRLIFFLFPRTINSFMFSVNEWFECFVLSWFACRPQNSKIVIFVNGFLKCILLRAYIWRCVLLKYWCTSVNSFLCPKASLIKNLYSLNCSFFALMGLSFPVMHWGFFLLYFHIQNLSQRFDHVV